MAEIGNIVSVKDRSRDENFHDVEIMQITRLTGRALGQRLQDRPRDESTTFGRLPFPRGKRSQENIRRMLGEY